MFKLMQELKITPKPGVDSNIGNDPSIRRFFLGYKYNNNRIVYAVYDPREPLEINHHELNINKYDIEPVNVTNITNFSIVRRRR